MTEVRGTPRIESCLRRQRKDHSVEWSFSLGSERDLGLNSKCQVTPEDGKSAVALFELQHLMVVEKFTYLWHNIPQQEF